MPKGRGLLALFSVNVKWTTIHQTRPSAKYYLLGVEILVPL
jgi:hypothetical protein